MRFWIALILLLGVACPGIGQQSKALVHCSESSRLRSAADAVKDKDSKEEELKDGDDDSKEQTFDAQKKILIVGHEGLGLGNYLISFPSAYNFAVVTGRDIVLADGTLIAEFCNIIMCGFHSYSYWLIKSELLAHTQADLRSKREKKRAEIRGIIAGKQQGSTDTGGNKPSSSSSSSIPKPQPNQGASKFRRALAASDGPGSRTSGGAGRERMQGNAISSKTAGTGTANKNGPKPSGGGDDNGKPKPKTKPKSAASGDKSKAVKDEKKEDHKQGVPSLRAFEFVSHFKGDYPLESYPAIHVYGYLHKTAWVWEVEDMENEEKAGTRAKDRYANRIYDCLEKISGCKSTHEQLHCIDSHALQQLVVGPFVNDGGSGKRDGLGSSDRSLSFEYLNKTTRNLPDHVADGLLHKKFMQAARMDVAVHIRNMFHFFEESEEGEETEAKAKHEVEAWLSSNHSNEGVAVFRELEKMILNVTGLANTPSGNSKNNNNRACRLVTVFVSADNAMVKQAFVDFLESRTPCDGVDSAAGEAHHGRQLRGKGIWRERIETVTNYFVPQKKAALGKGVAKILSVEEMEALKHSHGKKKTTPLAGASEGARNSSTTSREGSGLSPEIEAQIKKADHPGFMRTMVGAPTRSPTSRLINFSPRPNAEGAMFRVAHTTPAVYHSRQINKLNSHGTSSLDMVLDWYLIALSNNILSFRKDGTVSTFAWAAHMLNGPKKVKAFNLKFDKNLVPFWNPYTDSDGQVYG